MRLSPQRQVLVETTRNFGALKYIYFYFTTLVLLYGLYHTGRDFLGENKLKKKGKFFETKNLLPFTLSLTALNGDRMDFMRAKNEVNEKCMGLLTKLSITENLKEFGCQYISKIYHYKS